MDTSKVKTVIVIESEVTRPCPVCGERLGGSGEDFEKSLSHALEKHDYALLHVGPLTFRDDRDDLIHGVIAVCGSHKTFPPRPARDKDKPWVFGVK